MKPFLIICGMHRSGTSFLSRALNLSGVYLGELDSLISNEWNFLEDNLKGHWENKNFLELSEKTLVKSGGNWDNVPKQIKMTEEIRKDLQDCVDEIYSHPSLASGFKDPRILLLFEAWKEYFPENFILVGIFRNPLKVAESLKKRNNFDYEKSLNLWITYNQRMLEYLEKYNGFLINFDWPIKKILAEIKLINKKIGLDEKIDLSDWFDKELLHSDKTHDSNYELPHEIQSLQMKLEERSKQNSVVKIKKSSFRPDEFLAILHSKMEEIKNQGDYFKKIKNNLDNLANIQSNELAQIKKEYEERTNWALELDSKIKNRDTQLKKLQEEFEQRSKWAIQLDKESKEKNESIITLQEQITNKESQLKEAQEHVTIRESQLKEAQDNYYSVKNELEAMKNSILLKIPLSFAKNLDKAFPKSTKRGELIRLLRMSLLTLQNEGIGSLSQASQEKIKRQRLIKKKPFPKGKKHDFSESLQLGKINNSNIIQGDKNIKLDLNLRNFLDTEYYNISNMSVFPKVSIIIATFNQVDFLKKNLLSIESKTTYKNYEIIIVTNNLDEHSEMRRFLKTTKHRVCIFKNNYSFGEMNNFASTFANGEFLLFLNDDVEIVSASWLEYMLKVAINDKVGAVGPKLLFSDGKLQEAGGIVWKDGIIWNYGRNENPEDPNYNFVRNVDYCSGCCLMIKKELFEKLGKFDLQYKPAYCEDVDLCLAIQKEGLSILYQPLAVLIHYEGKTSGTDLKSGIKSYQVQNQKKFRIKWKSFLDSRLNDSQNNVFLERNRKKGINILYIDHYIPEYDKDAGSLLVYYLLSSLSYMDHKVTFWPDNLNKTEPYATNLQQKGVEVIYNHNNFQSFIKKHGNDFQICITTRAHIAPKYIELLKKHAPECKIIYDTVDLHFIREFREASLKQDSSKHLLAQKTKDLELEIFQKSDIVITKSLEEAHFLLNEDPQLNVSIIPTFDLPPKEFPPYEERKDLLFLGGFQHPPNVDSLEYLIKDLFPKIREKIPDVQLYVIGSNPTQEIIDMCSKVEGTIFLGYVKEIDPYLKKCRLLLAPLRFGAGVKGKITQSLAYGLVVITTPVGSEGISNENNKLLISNSNNEFVDNSISIYNDKELWTALSLNSIKYSQENFSPEYIQDTLKQTIQRCLQT